jgi:hypothetical protein
MDEPTGNTTLDALEPLIGEWDLVPRFSLPMAEDATGRVVFEWMPGRRFLIERWEVSLPEAPDGIALIGPDESGEGYVQHYFDSRGVARVYRMGFADGLWTLSRTTADFSPLDFSQRFTGRFSDDGSTIDGTWETSPDGTTWDKDFDLSYRRMA